MRFHLTVLVLLLAACASTPPATPPHDPTPSPEDIAAVLALANPGEEHGRLAALEGVWQQRGTFTFPGQPPLPFTSTATNKMILGGRFLQSHSVTAEGPFPMENLMIYGFDRRSREFTTVGFDTLGTYYITAAGKSTGPGQPITMSGVSRDPSNGRVEEYDMILTPLNANEYRFDVFFKQPGGARSHIVEIIYNRQETP